jgi:hypothetical protein
MRFLAPQALFLSVSRRSFFMKNRGNKQWRERVYIAITYTQLFQSDQQGKQERMMIPMAHVPMGDIQELWNQTGQHSWSAQDAGRAQRESARD